MYGDMLGPAQGASAPDLAEAIVGWRAWGLAFDKDGPVLTSPQRSHAWPAGKPFRAVFSAPEEQRERSHCGINAFATEYQLMNTKLADQPVIGSVNLWGQVRGYIKGWRAEMAYPHELQIHGNIADAEQIAHELSERYGITCTVRQIKGRSTSAPAIMATTERQLRHTIERMQGLDANLHFDASRASTPRKYAEIGQRTNLPLRVTGTFSASGNAYVQMASRHNERVKAWVRERAFVRACSYSEVNVEDQAKALVPEGTEAVVVQAAENSQVTSYAGHVAARQNSRVSLWRRATCDATGSSLVHAHEQTNVKATHHTTVHACDQTTVHAYGNATVHASGSAVVHTHGPRVTVHLTGDAQVIAHDLPQREKGQLRMPGPGPSWDCDVNENGHARFYVRLARYVTRRGAFGKDRSIGFIEALAEMQAADEVRILPTARAAFALAQHPDDRVIAVMCDASDIEHDVTERWGWVAKNSWSMVSYVDEDGRPVAD